MTMTLHAVADRLAIPASELWQQAVRAFLQRVDFLTAKLRQLDELMAAV
jgi:hypothetical protein